MTTPMETGPTDIRFLALGDSYTIGTAVDENECWPVLLATELGSTTGGGPAYQLEVDIIATKGWTTRDLLNGIDDRDDLNNNFDLVSLLIGVNNQYDGLSLPDYRIEFRQLLTTAIQLANKDSSRVFVIAIPDYAFTPSGGSSQQISDAIDEFNTAAQAIATELNVPFLNITPISRQAIADPELVATDKLHPSGKQYARWVDEVIAPAVRRYLA
jgi:lysophospholipase L1-like esterase